jgi:NAD(P)-dependent dehydrogenase (short-subunit alcohol dehydrogenase family)
MIRHIVLFRFRADVSETAIEAMFDEVKALHGRIEGLVAVSAGRSHSPEKIERGYMHALVVDFTDWAGLQRYQDDPDHKATGAKFVAACIGGIEGILVVDYEV